jgi:hypothetical protein
MSNSEFLCLSGFPTMNSKIPNFYVFKIKTLIYYTFNLIGPNSLGFILIDLSDHDVNCLLTVRKF